MIFVPIDFKLERTETDLFFENEMLLHNKKANFLVELIKAHVNKECELFSQKFISHTINNMRRRGCFTTETDDEVIRSGSLKYLTKASIGPNAYGIFANFIDDENRGDLISSYSIEFKIVQPCAIERSVQGSLTYTIMS